MGCMHFVNINMEVVVDLENVWKTVLNVFPFFKGLSAVHEESVEDDSCLELIHNSGLTDNVLRLVQGQLEHLMPSVADSFWAFFPEISDKSTATNEFDLFCDAVETLQDNVAPYERIMARLQTLMDMSGTTTINYNAASASDLLKIVLRATLHSRLGDFNTECIKTFYRTGFKVFSHSAAEDVTICNGCDHESQDCTCYITMRKFRRTNQILLDLNLLEHMTGDILTNFIQELIETHVKNTCKGSFEATYIELLERWLNTDIMHWIRHIYARECGDLSCSKLVKTFNTFEHKLTHSLYQIYTKTRIDQLFNIIIEYPDSVPAIEDLKICIEKTDLRSELTTKLQKSLVTRLLHPGVNTIDVLTAYISAIKALRQLDPTGVLLESVTQPVRQYLKNREDTIKCIINSLIEDGPSELAEELSMAKASGSSEYDDTLLDDMKAWTEWMPDPIDADVTQPSKTRRSCDVISMLVNVYGSKDLFVKEYTTLLAERLLSAPTYDTEREHRYLELLKLRFGDNELHTCEVMLKDIYDSTRINSHMDADQTEFPTSAKILSAPFWPAFKEEKLELPEYIKQQLETYTRAFEKQKGNRTLCWKNHLGLVHLSIVLSDRTLQVSTTPTRAAILWHFQDKNEWTIEDLGNEVQVPPMKLRREIAFWQSQGLLRESGTDRFILVEEAGDPDRPNENLELFEPSCEEAESVMASAQDQREEELGVFWSYIVGMLTNLESMQIDRIYQMLKMFATQGSTAVDCSQVELQTFLDRKVKEHKLLFSGGLYRLPKL